MTDGIILRIMGDFGPFSRMGKSIGYQLEIGKSVFLVDCGAPLFQQIGGHGLKKIDGLLVTHCHDDHKRWFSDFALFCLYARDVSRKVFLMTSEDVHRDIRDASMPALGKSLSMDSKKVVDIAYEDYVDFRMIGPRAKYAITRRDEGKGRTVLCVADGGGALVGPDRAKVVINPGTGMPRMLFKDPEYGEWVEPESFYPFSSEVFYEREKNLYEGAGEFAIEAVKAPVWHGVSCIGLKVKTACETLVFSSDTAHDRALWKQLCTEKRIRSSSMTEKEFSRSEVIYGDINDFIERTWSEARYRDAISAFDDAVVLHDVSCCGSVVHTDYEKLKSTDLRRDRVLLTHSPDRFTSEWALCNAGKTFLIRKNEIFELAGDKCWPLDADVYHKEQGRFYAGYRNEESGKYTVYEKDGLLRFHSYDETPTGMPRYRVDLYEDISGRYFPRIEGMNAFYHERPDGKVELIKYGKDGSSGTIVEDCRGKIKLTDR